MGRIPQHLLETYQKAQLPTEGNTGEGHTPSQHASPVCLYPR